jgi:hypothetical protein
VRAGDICEIITKIHRDNGKKRDRSSELIFIDPYHRRFLERILKEADQRLTIVMK